MRILTATKFLAATTGALLLATGTAYALGDDKPAAPSQALIAHTGDVEIDHNAPVITRENMLIHAPCTPSGRSRPTSRNGPPGSPTSSPSSRTPPDACGPAPPSAGPPRASTSPLPSVRSTLASAWPGAAPPRASPPSTCGRSPPPPTASSSTPRSPGPAPPSKPTRPPCRPPSTTPSTTGSTTSSTRPRPSPDIPLLARNGCPFWCGATRACYISRQVYEFSRFNSALMHVRYQACLPVPGASRQRRRAEAPVKIGTAPRRRS